MPVDKPCEQVSRDHRGHRADDGADDRQTGSMDAGELGHGRVRLHRVQPPSECGVREKDRGDGRQHEPDHHPKREMAERMGREVGQQGRRVLASVAGGVDEQRPLEDRERPQRHDDRRDPQYSDADAIDKPDDRAGSQQRGDEPQEAAVLACDPRPVGGRPDREHHVGAERDDEGSGDRPAESAAAGE